MWHVSNEYGCHNARCYCDVSAAAFRRWLEDRYVTLARLNDAWGTTVWGQRYSAWEEIMPPRVAPTFRNPTQMVDFRRFSNNEFLARFRAERAVLRRVTPDIPITTNFMVIRHFNELDYWTWSEEPDFISNDHYLTGADTNAHRELAFCADLTRGLAGGEPWLLMEHSTSAVNWQPRNIAKEPGEMIRNSMAHIARGSDGALFFQWRQARAGSEKFHSGMVPHAGRESRVFREVVELGGALRKIAVVKGSRVESRIAMIYDWESWWASESESHPTIDFKYRDIGHIYHHALTASGHTVDFVAPGSSIGDHALVIVPGLYMINEHDAAVIGDFVAGGGTAIITYGTGVADDDDHAWLGGYPGPLRDVAGVSVEEVHPLRAGERVTLDDGGNADVWTERVNLLTAESIASFDSGPVAGLPAITRNVSGSGVAWYVATRLDERSVQKLVDRILDETGLAVIERPPSGVEMVRRKGERSSYLFVINHSDSAVELSTSGTDLLTGVTGPVSVAAGGVAVVEEEDG
jgi:beta-galactosidase